MIIIITITYFYNFSYSLLESIEDEMKLVATVDKFWCSTSSGLKF